MSILRLGLFGLLLGATSPSQAAGADAIAEVGPFRFEQGARIADMRVGYCLHGRLNAARHNAILLLPPTSGTRHSYDALIVPGKAFDTDRFMVITADPIGGGLSSKPSDGLRDRFPHYTIRDMVAAEARLVHTVLKLDHLRAVAGASMGSFQAIEWAVRLPDSIDRLVLVAPAARSDAHLRSTVDGMAAILGGMGSGGTQRVGCARLPHSSCPGIAAMPIWSDVARQPIAARSTSWRAAGHGLGRIGSAVSVPRERPTGDRSAFQWQRAHCAGADQGNDAGGAHQQ